MEYRSYCTIFMKTMKKIIILILLQVVNLHALSWNDQIKMEKIFDTFKEKYLVSKTGKEQLAVINAGLKALDLYIKKHSSAQSSFNYLSYLLCQERSIQAGIICTLPYRPSSIYTENAADITLHEIRKRLTMEHNNRRIERWLAVLSENLVLHNIAQDYALKLCKAGEITHTLDNSTLEQRFEDGGYDYVYWWENLAQWQENIMETLDQLTTSYYHRVNMYHKSYSEIGIGHCDTIWVINYGTSRKL